MDTSDGKEESGIPERFPLTVRTDRPTNPSEIKTVKKIIQKIATEINSIASIAVGTQTYVYASGIRLTMHMGKNTLSVTVAPDIIGYTGAGHTIEFSSLGDLKISLYRLDNAVKAAIDDAIQDHVMTIGRLRDERDDEPCHRVNYDAKTDDHFMMNGNVLRVIVSYPDAVLCESLERSYNFTYNSLQQHGAFYVDTPATWLRKLEC
jgi:hypothetical protein